MNRQTADASLLERVPDHVGPRKMAFRGGAVHWRQPPGSLSFVSTGHSMAIRLARSPGFRFAFDSERSREFDLIAGMLGIAPAGMECKAEWSAPIESVVVALSPESMRELAGHEVDRPDVEIRPINHVVDNTALQLAKMIKAELSRPEHANELYLDSLITLIGVHVLRNYSSAAKPLKPVDGGLSTIAANRIREYLHEHFRRKLTISELAATCGLSPGYFTQAFAKTFGMPPHRYVLERRLDFAEKLLVGTQMPVAEIAFLSAFSSQSHLTSMMKTHRDKTPRQFR
ncbi:helix-turn-helix transcriptional regulator [Sinorhizobium meliloti]|uniref:helix-turn-helix transcriptional regulator n=1 Tax=Rhizobium meliloti TaxID=382 RepID=UPI000EFD4AC4|nr:AraC family transcriptional regulator [Sinorhizobium meliloti]RMC65473.1 AraC family transcriptional regulator [Sinorhizobium meliloti]